MGADHRGRPGGLECPSFPKERTWSPERETTVVDGVADSPWNDASVGATVVSWFDYLEANLDSAWSMEVEFDPVHGNPTWMSVTNREYTDTLDPVPFETFVIQAVTVAPL